MRCSKDLRQRVIGFVRSGESKAEAAHRFQVSRGRVYNWLNAADALSYRRPGPKAGRRLAWEALRRQVEQQADLTQKERARYFGVARHCIWNALWKMGLFRKKQERLPRTQPYAAQKVSASS